MTWVEGIVPEEHRGKNHKCGDFEVEQEKGISP